MKVHAVLSWHPFGFPKPYAGFGSEDGRIYMVLGVEERAALARDLPDARNWITRKITGHDKRGGIVLGRHGTALGRQESFHSGETLALAINRAEIVVSPFIGEGDQVAPRPPLTWGTAMILDAARKVAALAKIQLIPQDECWAQ